MSVSRIGREWLYSYEEGLNLIPSDTLDSLIGLEYTKVRGIYTQNDDVFILWIISNFLEDLSRRLSES